MLSNSSNEGKRSSKRNVDSFGDTRKYKVGNTYAVIVGISNYKHSKWNLKYADRDAEELYQLLLTPSGGGFEERNVKKLINEQATTLGITKALRSFLKAPDKEDLVLLFFACHATPDEIRPTNIYLLTHDTDANDISGTALPMREIDLSLRENLLAERIVIIADTCHSASIGGSIIRRSAIDDARVINAYLQKVSEAKGGVALLTSAEASETSQEDQKWGGGHGVLTYFLLKGMKGDADGYGGQPKDGTVTVGELFDYVRDNVKEATDNQQHPSIGTNLFDRNLTLSITGGINAQEHYQIGSRLYDLGWLLDDIELFRSSAQQFGEAVRLAHSAKTPLPAAELGFAQAKLAYGAYEETLHDLSKLSTEQDDKEVQSEALFLKGIAQAKIYDINAPETFEIFHAQFPEHHNTLWAKDYASWLRNHTKGRRYGLLIGINRYVTSVVPPLAGCLNDVNRVNKVLTQHCNFDETDIFTLVDEAATRNGIFEAFKELTKKTTVADTVIIHYSGHSIGEKSKDKAPEFSDTYLIVRDTEFDPKLGISINGITSDDLHELVSMIPAERKTLILDTHPCIRFNELVKRDGKYTLLLASDSAEVAYEQQIKVDGEYLSVGAFTSTLVEQLEKFDPSALTHGQLIDGILSKMTKHALLVGIDDYLSHSITSSRGAVNDVLALKQILMTKFGFLEENITTLLNHNATYSAILESFKRLVEQARNEPALFYFSGNGSRSKDGFPVIISVDGREGQVYDIDVRELYELAKGKRERTLTLKIIILKQGITLGASYLRVRKISHAL